MASGRLSQVGEPEPTVDRRPLTPADLPTRHSSADRPWRDIRFVAQTGSTNFDLLAEAEAGEAEGLVLVAEQQTAGRGRLDRRWESPASAGLTFSALLRPEGVLPSRWGWLPLLAGFSLWQAIVELSAVDNSQRTNRPLDQPLPLSVALKWPNDLLLGSQARKVAGILTQVKGGAVVVGIGLNVSTQRGELATPQATSLLLEGCPVLDRGAVLSVILDKLAGNYRRWTAAAGDPYTSGLLRDYCATCDTIGREVEVDVPASQTISGKAIALDEDARLVVRTDSVVRAVAAGDVRHVRPKTSRLS